MNSRSLLPLFTGLLGWLLAGLAPLLAASEQDASYMLRPNDMVSLSVYEEPELSVQVRILKTGQASFPLVGSVKIGGLSVVDAAAAIRALYAKDYLVDPKVTLSVEEYTTDFISVIGQVKAPGQYPIPQSGHLDLGSALATAGGTTPDADITRIQLVRASGASSTFTLDAIQGAAGRTRLLSGDRIVVQESRFVRRHVTVLGRVAKPGAVTFPIDGRLDLVTAVAMAGGLTELANDKKVSINRRGRITVINFREVSQRGGQPHWLEPDDIITVAERFF